MRKPYLIGLCGQPGSGKSAIQEVLYKEFNIQPVDDGAIIRQHCSELFDADIEDLQTQEGKRGFMDVNGAEWQRRKVLGEYGYALEKTFGELTVPNYAIRKVLKNHSRIDGPVGYSFGSVRRGQGAAYINAGGIVIEVVRSGVLESENLWDGYEQDYVSYTFRNDSDSLEEMNNRFINFFRALKYIGAL